MELVIWTVVGTLYVVGWVVASIIVADDVAGSSIGASDAAFGGVVGLFWPILVPIILVPLAGSLILRRLLYTEEDVS